MFKVTDCVFRRILRDLPIYSKRNILKRNITALNIIKYHVFIHQFYRVKKNYVLNKTLVSMKYENNLKSLNTVYVAVSSFSVQ